MSIDGARYIVEGVAAALMELFPQYADQVGDNLEAAAARLDELAGQMHAAAENAQGVRVILMNEALVYTAEELGLEIAGQYDHESGEPLYEGDADDCLAQLAAMDANVVLVEKQAPASLTDALEEAAISYRALMCSPRGARTWARRGTLRRRWKTRKRSRGFRAGGGQELKQVEIYTDGACSGNPGPGGWGGDPHLSGQTRRAFRLRGAYHQQSHGADGGHSAACARSRSRVPCACIRTAHILSTPLKKSGCKTGRSVTGSPPPESP